MSALAPALSWGATDERAERRGYATIDGLRGVAAMAVVFYHFASDLGVAHGYLAVDLFFVMSGFVVASAYEARLTSGGLNLGQFLGIRVRRLAPLWVLGMLVGYVMATLVPAPAPERTLWQLGLGLLLIPQATTLIGAFPMNTSLWSLHVELVVNLVYALLVRWLTNARLLAVAAASFIALALIATHVGALSAGSSPWDLLCGYLRALVSFPIGVVLWRERRRLPTIKANALSLLLVMGLLMTGCGVAARSPAGVWYDLAFIAIASPIFVAAAVNTEPTANLRRSFLAMGAASYALYVLHQPLIHAARRFAADHGGIPTYLAFEAVMLPSLVVLALLVDRFLDAPFRSFISRKVPDLQLLRRPMG